MYIVGDVDRRSMLSKGDVWIRAMVIEVDAVAME